MIIPVANEKEWAAMLAALPEWRPQNVPTVVVVPHPDDETLAAGGLIALLVAMGATVQVVAVTDGENAYQRNEGLAERRRNEQMQALARLGVPADHVVRLEFVDSGLATHEDDLAARLRPLVEPGTQVLAPWVGDFHPDHEVCGRAARSIARETGAALISYFFWTWHRGTPMTLQNLNLVRLPLSESARRMKWDALACHESQLKHAPEPEVLAQNLLWPAQMPFEVFAL